MQKKMSNKEQLSIYMKLSKKRLSEMLLEANKTIEVLKCFQPIEEIPLSETITDTTYIDTKETDAITEMHSIASFNKIVKNYTKMKRIENEAN
jgi:hypothetical protein